MPIAGAAHGLNRVQPVRVLQPADRAGHAAPYGRLPSLQGLPAHAGPLGSAREPAAGARR